MRYKYRLKFSKEDKMRFIGHLDLLKLFQRTIKRADIPISYSNGFNPHQIISFALPLSLGMGSLGEYIDMELDKEMDGAQVVERLNAHMPLGIKVLACRLIGAEEKNAAALTEAAAYSIIFPDEHSHFDNLEQILEHILLQNEILIQKKTKKGNTEVDIRPDIFEVKNISDEKQCRIAITIAAGSTRNLKPELFASYLFSMLNTEYDPYTIRYVREDMMKKADGRFVSLYEI